MASLFGAPSTGEATVLIQEPLGLFGHKDADLFALEGKRDAQPAQVHIGDGDFGETYVKAGDYAQAVLYWQRRVAYDRAVGHSALPQHCARLAEVRRLANAGSVEICQVSQT